MAEKVYINAMKRIIIIFLFFGLCLQLVAQKDKVDSLVVLLKSAKDTGKVNLLNELSKSLWYYQLDKAAEYNTIALRVADSINYQKGLAEANRCRGVILSFRKDSTGMVYLAKALTIFKNINDKRGIAATLNNQNAFYIRQGNLAEALEGSFASLKLFQELNDQEAVGAVTNQLGYIYSQQSDFSTALDYFLKALEIRRQIGDKPGTAFSLTRVGDMYEKLNKLPEALDYYQQAYKLAQTVGRNQNLVDVTISMGELFQKQGKYDEALSYYNISLKAAEDFYGKDSVFASYQLIGDVYLAQKKYGLALVNFEKALDIANKKRPSESAALLHSIGELYYEQGDYAKALENANASLGIAQKNKTFTLIKDASFTLSKIYAAAKDYPKAYQYQLQYDLAKDSVLNQDLNRRLASLQQSLEIKNRQTQIDLLSRDQQLKESELNRQKQQRYAFIIGILLFLILVIVLARSNRRKQKTNYLLQNTLSDLKATQAQLIQSEKMASLGELTAGIAHEIQNPLNFVNNFSEVNNELIEELESELKSNNNDEAILIAKDIKENEQKINHHGRRADAIVKNMLQHSKSGGANKELTDINKLADEYLRLSYHGLRAKDKSFNADFKADFDDNVGKINVIPQDIGRVLINLFNNAFYAVNEKLRAQSSQLTADYKPLVYVKTKKTNNKIEIIVKDNGNGIPQNIVDKIFQPFFTTKPTGQGTGLGLSLSYDIIKAHGGEIKVETKEGEGTEFIIQLAPI